MKLAVVVTDKRAAAAPGALLQVRPALLDGARAAPGTEQVFSPSLNIGTDTPTASARLLR